MRQLCSCKKQQSETPQMFLAKNTEAKKHSAVIQAAVDAAPLTVLLIKTLIYFVQIHIHDV